jgi:hypothetical protein
MKIVWALFWRMTLLGTVASVVYAFVAMLVLVPAASVLLKLMMPSNPLLPWPPTFEEAKHLATSTLILPMGLTQLLIIRHFFKKGIGQYRLALVANRKD